MPIPHGKTPKKCQYQKLPPNTACLCHSRKRPIPRNTPNTAPSGPHPGQGNTTQYRAIPPPLAQFPRALHKCQSLKSAKPERATPRNIAQYRPFRTPPGTRPIPRNTAQYRPFRAQQIPPDTAFSGSPAEGQHPKVALTSAYTSCRFANASCPAVLRAAAAHRKRSSLEESGRLSHVGFGRRNFWPGDRGGPEQEVPQVSEGVRTWSSRMRRTPHEMLPDCS